MISRGWCYQSRAQLRNDQGDSGTSQICHAKGQICHAKGQLWEAMES
jgi:hypothetical protein